MRRRGKSLIFVVLLFSGGSLFAQTPAERFEKAREAFHYQEYDKVIEILGPLLYPEPTLPSADMVQQGREWLGSAKWWKGDKAGFKQEFTRLLQSRPEFELDSFYYPPEMVAEFTDLKKQLAELKLIQQDRPEAKTREVVEKTYAEHSAIVNFMPFGGGQFANGSSGKGFLFMAGQAAALAANMGSWYYLYAAGPTGGARTAGLAGMYGSLAVFGGIYVWSIVDSFDSYQPRRLLEEKRLEIPEESASMGRIVPLPMGGSGAGLGWVTSF